jgi:hypothetical protein
VALLATLVLGALAFMRTRPIITTDTPAAELSFPPRHAAPVSSAMPGRETAVPREPHLTGPAIGAAAPAAPSAAPRPVASTEVAATDATGEGPQAAGLAPEGPAAASGTAAPFRSAGKPKEDALGAAWAAAEGHPHLPAGRAPTKAAVSSRAEGRTEGRTVAKAAVPSVIVDPWARPPRSPAAVAAPRQAPAAPAACSVRFGTQPWADVWIDGKNTGGHTPYSASIPCGSHQVMFKRRDLGLTKTYTVQARPGEPLRQSFPFEP